MRQVYLDHQSATPVLPEALGAMQPFFASGFGNPASLHSYGLRAREAIDQARIHLAAFLDTPSPEEIVFTSGGTEAVNLGIKGAAFARRRQGNHIVTSTIEHPAVLNSIAFLETEGFSCTRVPVDREGRIDPAAMRSALTEQTVLVAVHLANHEVGTLQPIEAIARFTAEARVPLFVDAVAAAGWVPIDVQAMGIDLLALSPQRFHGPKGVGVLYLRRGIRIASLIHGGDQEGGRRAGTENVPAIVGAGVAADVARRSRTDRVAHVGRLQQRAWDGLRSQVTDIRLNGPTPGRDRLCANLNVSLGGVDGEGLMLACDVQGVVFASGTACASHSLKLSPVLTAMGADHTTALGSILLTLGKDTTRAEIDHAVATISGVATRLRRLSPAWQDSRNGEINPGLAAGGDRGDAPRP